MTPPVIAPAQYWPDDEMDEQRPRGRRFWRMLASSRLAIPGGVVVLIVSLAALFAPWVAPFDPLKSDLARVLLPPDAIHWFGTDELGRDLFSRVVHGARISLIEGFGSVALALAVGVPLGIVSGYAGGWLDLIVMRLVDILMAFPGVLLAIVVVSILGTGLENAMLAVAIYTIPIFARLARASTLAVKQEPYIEACRVAGMSRIRILWRHVLPNIAATLMVVAALRVAISILTAASLGFLGIGAEPPLPEWGTMLANGRNYLLVAPHLVLFPGAAIIVLVLGLNLLQDGLRVALDPKTADR